MYKQIYNKVFGEFSGELAKQNLISIYSSDRYSDYKSFADTAKWCCNKMKEIGLSEVEIINYKSDGVSKLGVATPPQAWDAFDARLEIILPDGKKEVIADHKTTPISIAMYSAPTKGVIETEIVDIESIKHPSEMKGKIVLSSDRGGQVADYVMKNKGAGLVLDFVSQSWIPGKRMKETDAVYWENACFIPKNKYKGFAFVISPAAGFKLRKLLKSSKIKARAFVKTRLYKGNVGTVTGIIPGIKNKEEEVLVVSHLYEIGANDNASGSGINLETARALIVLIKKGILPRPKRSIRFILPFEIFGLLSFFEAKKGKAAKIIAGLNIDMVGEDEDITGAVLNVVKSWPSNPSFVNDLVLRLIEETCKWKPCRWKENNYKMFDDDSFIAEPSIGIPTPYLLYTSDKFYHSNKDTPNNVSIVSLKRIGVVTGTYLYFLANAGVKEACWLGEEIAASAKIRVIRALQEVLSNSGDLEKEIKKIDHLIDIEERGLNDLTKLSSGNAWNKHYLRQQIQRLSFDFRQTFKSSYKNVFKNIKITQEAGLNKAVLAGMNKIIPVKSFIGMPLSWVISEQDKKNFAKLAGVLPGVSVIKIMSWINGKRTVHEIFNILRVNYDLKPEAIMRWFKLSAKYKYIKLKKNNRITRDDLINDLKNMGIKKGDVVFVHSSLGSIGIVEGGADTVVDALIESVSPQGTVIVPTLTATFLEGLYAFNPGKTPSRVGEITNALLKRPDSFRSQHPTHSIAAVGKGAQELVKGHTSSTFSKDGPYGKYVSLNAKILFIGTGIGCNTTLHAVEDWLDLPYLTTEKAVVEDVNGRDRIVKVTKCPSGCRDFYKKDSKIKKVFEKEGIIKKGKLGNAEVIIINAKDVVNATVKEIRKGRLDILLCNRPDCKFCKNGRKLLKKNKAKIMKNIDNIRKIGLCC
ncbi:MAG: AAC(3) family N-acetyltransferase [Candidatus Firestonebacteria bacterium]